MIGAIAWREPAKPLEVVIVSSDKDMLQLVNKRVFMLNPMKDDEWYDEAKVEEFMGVKPSQVADLLALKGDAIDNIPGAPGIGDKGARDIIAKFGSVEEALIAPPKWNEKCTARACKTIARKLNSANNSPRFKPTSRSNGISPPYAPSRPTPAL